MIRFERLREILKTEAYLDFVRFMEGQTVEEGGLFEDDFLRWVKRLKEID